MEGAGRGGGGCPPWNLQPSLWLPRALFPLHMGVLQSLRCSWETGDALCRRGCVEGLTPVASTAMGAGETKVGPGPRVSQGAGCYQCLASLLTPTGSSGRRTITVSSWHGQQELPGQSSERCWAEDIARTDPPAPAQPPRWLPRTGFRAHLTCIFSIISNRSVFCKRWGEQVSAAWPRRPHKSPRHLHPALLVLQL